MNKTKFAIGCLVQWYEVDIIGEYVETLREAIDHYDGEVFVDVAVVIDQTLEKCTSKQTHQECKEKILNLVKGVDECKIGIINSLYTIADYRREFNDKYCEEVDVLVWGESDMLVPKQMFEVLDMLHQSTSDDTPKYLATFGTCKMWDKGWEPLEHVDFTVKPYTENLGDWWNTNYTMNKEEMNKFNNKVDELQVTTIPTHKFNGCGLVISSEVIKSGVNIPRGMFFVHEDTAFMHVTQKVLGNIPQYHFKNILLVHNRKHPNKRMYIQNEDDVPSTSPGAKRRKHDWYRKAFEFSTDNLNNIFNPNYKFKTWKNVWK